MNNIHIISSNLTLIEKNHNNFSCEIGYLLMNKRNKGDEFCWFFYELPARRVKMVKQHRMYKNHSKLFLHLVHVCNFPHELYRWHWTHRTEAIS